ncbi:uncharacterized protein BDR25DRAFT_394676 [Lindgomyces ingoldianus]|uniref:Uncharacterized protein n=1 Tax=Lindgomyces ingoldianus TaxID=673940 RepID=A0ACB6QPI0_9PLEO|nr:uncharacterized protein BDR25DRAFT_394676 [Lindgomyces ingoldianus]KAF2468898.1 hypothetical protein BDR25DRAFT_394676 [Lindgomyces ingoldianus]
MNFIYIFLASAACKYASIFSTFQRRELSSIVLLLPIFVFLEWFLGKGHIDNPAVYIIGLRRNWAYKTKKGQSLEATERKPNFHKQNGMKESLEAALDVGTGCRTIYEAQKDVT